MYPKFHVSIHDLETLVLCKNEQVNLQDILKSKIKINIRQVSMSAK